jgi:hypothetical protein
MEIILETEGGIFFKFLNAKLLSLLLTILPECLQNLKNFCQQDNIYVTCQKS